MLDREEYIQAFNFIKRLSIMTGITYPRSGIPFTSDGYDVTVVYCIPSALAMMRIDIESNNPIQSSTPDQVVEWFKNLIKSSMCDSAYVVGDMSEANRVLDKFKLGATK